MKAFTVVIEGSDGAGKETQALLLSSALQLMGKRVTTVSFPRYSDTLSGKILHYSLGKNVKHVPDFIFADMDPRAASLIYAGDRLESLPHLMKLMQGYDVIIFDRYIQANLLHQGGKFKNDKQRVEFASWLLDLEHDSLGLPKPDLVIYLSLPWEASEARAKARAQLTGTPMDLVESNKVYLQNSHQAGKFYAKHFDWGVADCVQDGRELTREEVSTIVMEIVLAKMKL